MDPQQPTNMTTPGSKQGKDPSGCATRFFSKSLEWSEIIIFTVRPGLLLQTLFSAQAKALVVSDRLGQWWWWCRDSLLNYGAMVAPNWGAPGCMVPNCIDPGGGPPPGCIVPNCTDPMVGPGPGIGIVGGAMVPPSIPGGAIVPPICIDVPCGAIVAPTKPPPSIIGGAMVAPIICIEVPCGGCIVPMSCWGGMPGIIVPPWKPWTEVVGPVNVCSERPGVTVRRSCMNASPAGTTSSLI